MFDCLLPTQPLHPPRRLATWQARRASELLLAHLDRGITVTELAQACALSRSDFTRKFKASFGHSPQDWLRHQRIAQAKRMLSEQSLTLADIGLACGFFDQAHFCRIFVRFEGVTPLKWRQARSDA